MGKHTILKPELGQIAGLESAAQTFEQLETTDPLRQEILQKFENDEFIVKEINKEYTLSQIKEMFVYHPVEAVDPLVFYKGKQIVTYF
jgi:hypothetical protein